MPLYPFGKHVRRRRRFQARSRSRAGHGGTGRAGIEGLESRAMLAADDVLVSLAANRVVLALDPAGAAITNLTTAYDAPSARLTITASTAGTLAMAAPVDGISVDTAAGTVTVDLRTITRFAGLSVLGGAATDSVRIGPGGVNLVGIDRGGAAQGFIVDTGEGSGDSITVAGQIVAKGAGLVGLATKAAGVARGILLASSVVTARGSQSYGGGVTLLNGVALQAGRDISFTSTIDGFGRLQLSAGRTVTMAGDVGRSLPLQGITLTKANRVLVGGGLVLDGSGTAAGTSGFVVGANVHAVVFSAGAAARTISGFSGAGIRFVGGSSGSRISGVTSTGNGTGLLLGPGGYAGTVISGNAFSGNVGSGVSLQAARAVTIGGRAAGSGNEIVSNGGFGIAARGRCSGAFVVGNEIGDNALGQIENYLASTLAGRRLFLSATGLQFLLTDIGRAAYRSQKAHSYSFDVGVEAFAVAARSKGWLDTRTAAVDIDASVAFGGVAPQQPQPWAVHRTMLGQNLLATSLTPVRTLPGLEFAQGVQAVGTDQYGRHYRASIGLSTFAGLIPLADLPSASSVGRDGSPVPVDVWVNRQGHVSRVAATFTGGSFEMSLQGQGRAGYVPASIGLRPPGVLAAAAVVPSTPPATIQVASPQLPGTTNGVSGVRQGHATLAIPYGGGVVVPVDWYFPTQVDGSVASQGVIWLQHGSGATGGSLAMLASDLARQTNSIVMAPSLPAGMNWSLAGTAVSRAVASLFEGSRAAISASAASAGYTGQPAGLTGRFVLAGHSTGGGFVTAVASDYVANVTTNQLAGVLMYDGVSAAAFASTGGFATQVAALDAGSIPIYQLAAPAQLWNAYGATTNALLTVAPGRFRGLVLSGGSHVDAVMGGSVTDDILTQRLTTESRPGVAAAARLLTAGWINDMYAGGTPAAPLYGLYAPENSPILAGDAAATALPSPVANTWSATDRRLDAERAAIGVLSGFQPVSAVNTGGNGLSAAVAPQYGNRATGVTTGTSPLDIPVGMNGLVTSADWYFPTRADGTVSANGLIWLQRGGTGDAAALAAFARQLAAQTNSIVVAPAISSFEIPGQPDGFLGSQALQQAVAGMMAHGRGSLSVSAAAAGYQGLLPQRVLLAGQGTGGGFAAAAGASMVDNGTAVNLLGVVMVDGTAPADEFAPAVAKLDSLGIPTYQIASPPRAENAWGSTTEQLALLHPDQFVGVQLDVSAASDAVVTLATGWINDMYDGSYAPTNPYYGIYGSPNDGTYVSNQRIMMGGTAATTLPAPPPVDIAQYAGTWYEQGSVKQPPASGRVNTQVTYTPEPDGSVTVAWAGNEGSPTGPAWSVTGVAIPVNAPFNTRLNVSFSGQPDTNEPGTSWILDYAPDYSWAIIGDPTGTSGTVLTRDRVISPTDYTALVDQAYRLGVRGVITPTLQSP